jgi:hypothetical protein
MKTDARIDRRDWVGPAIASGGHSHAARVSPAPTVAAHREAR